MRKITTIFLLAILAVSCSADNPEDGVVNVDLEGNWVLENVSCFCYFEPDTDFSTHQISFTGSKLSVISDGGNFYLAESGEYSYTVEGNLLTMPDGAQYRYQQEDDTLQLVFVDNPEIADDEMALSYYKR